MLGRPLNSNNRQRRQHKNALSDYVESFPATQLEVGIASAQSAGLRGMDRDLGPGPFRGAAMCWSNCCQRFRRRLWTEDHSRSPVPRLRWHTLCERATHTLWDEPVDVHCISRSVYCLQNSPDKTYHCARVLLEDLRWDQQQRARLGKRGGVWQRWNLRRLVELQRNCQLYASAQLQHPLLLRRLWRRGRYLRGCHSNQRRLTGYLRVRGESSRYLRESLTNVRCAGRALPGNDGSGPRFPHDVVSSSPVGACTGTRTLSSYLCDAPPSTEPTPVLTVRVVVRDAVRTLTADPRPYISCKLQPMPLSRDPDGQIVGYFIYGDADASDLEALRSEFPACGEGKGNTGGTDMASSRLPEGSVSAAHADLSRKENLPAATITFGLYDDSARVLLISYCGGKWHGEDLNAMDIDLRRRATYDMLKRLPSAVQALLDEHRKLGDDQVS